MKIAITADPEIPVPPRLYGGIERIVDLLVRGLMARGHEVTLFAHPASDVPCRLIAYPGQRSQNRWDTVRNTIAVTRVLTGEYDLVHSFGRLAYLTALLPAALPKLMSYQREPSVPQITKALRLAQKGTLSFTGCSEYIAAQIRPYATSYAVPNGVALHKYQFNPTVSADAPLAFLGRVEEIKGVHLAIEVARRSERQLVIAGNVPDDAASRAYFQQCIRPHLDERQIHYLGAVNDAQKNELLGGAAALLMPILWNEPFGIVMAEALACGTPVLAFARGAVPEVVQHGTNGFLCASTDEMSQAVATVRFSRM